MQLVPYIVYKSGDEMSYFVGCVFSNYCLLSHIEHTDWYAVRAPYQAYACDYIAKSSFTYSSKSAMQQLVNVLQRDKHNKSQQQNIS